jgi:radical SAM protein with 4Fe4S-binding SPASM domain
MRPLRFERVIKKIDALLHDFRGKVYVAVPWHRKNDSERQKIADYFLKQECKEIQFFGLSNRCSTSPTFQELAFEPFPHPCRGEILQNLIFDWDGKVFPCCNDFRKIDPIGNLSNSSVREVMTSREREAFGFKLDQGAWPTMPTCSTCLWDKVSTYKVASI